MKFWTILLITLLSIITISCSKKEIIISSESINCNDSRIFVSFTIDSLYQFQNFNFKPRACDEATEVEIINSIKKMPFKDYKKKVIYTIPVFIR